MRGTRMPEQGKLWSWRLRRETRPHGKVGRVCTPCCLLHCEDASSRYCSEGDGGSAQSGRSGFRRAHDGVFSPRPGLRSPRRLGHRRSGWGVGRGCGGGGGASSPWLPCQSTDLSSPSRRKDAKSSGDARCSWEGRNHMQEGSPHRHSN